MTIWSAHFIIGITHSITPYFPGDLALSKPNYTNQLINGG
jgi:hypothetical protein